MKRRDQFSFQFSRCLLSPDRDYKDVATRGDSPWHEINSVENSSWKLRNRYSGPWIFASSIDRFATRRF